MSLPLPPDITQGQLALDPVNGIVYYRDAENNLVATTWSWLRQDMQEIRTDDNVTITGDLTVSGTTVSVNVESVTVADNILILNSNVTGSPTENAGIEIERGTSSNVQIRWNEYTDSWQYTNDGTNFYDITNISFSSLDELSDVTITSAESGQMLMYFDGEWVNSTLPTNEPMGHQNKDESIISFNNSTREFSIAPVSTNHYVWCKGKRFTKSTTETVTISNTSGLHYIYYNSLGVLSHKTSYFDFENESPVAYIYWNATDSTNYFFADERHGIVLDWQTHEYLHRTRGAVIASGFGANGYNVSGDGSSNSDAQISLADGTFFDEDMQIDITHSATPAANTWQQRLQSGAYIPVFYHNGTSWKKDTATQFPLKQGTSRPRYNLNTAGVWSTVDVDNAKFSVVYIVATNNLSEPVISILGQSQYTDLGSAEAAVWEDLNLDGFPVFEFRALYKIIFQAADAYTNTPKARFRGVYDLRRIVASGNSIPTTPVSDHGSMTGLQDDDHPQYLNETRHNALNHSTALNSAVINDLGDVVITSVATGDFLRYDGSNWINDPVNLATDTVGNYVQNLVAGTGISITNNTGEAATPSIAIDSTVATLSGSQSLTNKTIALGSNTISGTKAQFDTAVTDDNFAYIGQANSFTANQSITGTVTTRASALQDGIILQGRAGGNTTLSVTITPTTLTSSRTFTLPNVDGTAITTGDTGTVTNTMLAGSIANNKLVNSSITINSSSTALGGSVTLYAGTTTLQTSSANQALTGISSITLPGATSGSVQLVPTTAVGTGTVLTIPATTGTIVTTGDTGTVTSTMIANNTILDADINSNAGIAVSKLATATPGYIILANASNVPTYTNVTGKITISSTGVTSLNASIDDLSDVIITSPVLNQAITYNGTNWVNSTLAGGGTVTSITAGTGLTGGTISTSGTIALSVPVSIANGGTNSTTATGAMANLVGYTSTATAGGSTTLTNSSSYYQQFTGSSNQTIVLPVTSTLQTGWTFYIANSSTGTLTVNSSGGNLVISIPSQTAAALTCIGTTLTTAADWKYGLTDFTNYTGTGNLVLSASPTFTGTPLSTTAAVDTNTTQIATTAFVLGQASGTNPTSLGSVAIGTSTRYARADHVHPTTGLGLTSGTLAQFSSTTSSQLAGVISDETGSGSLVFGTSPAITTSLTTGSASFDLINATATTVNFAGAATTLAIGGSSGTLTIGNATITATNATVFNINGASPSIVTSSTGTASIFNTNALTGSIFGASSTINIGNTITAAQTFNLGTASTGASTYNLATGATANATTKTINLGTGGAAGSTTNVNIGSSSGGTTTVNNNLVVSGDLTVNGTTTTVNSTTLTVDDKNIELGSVTSPSNTTADGGGITLKGATDKTFNWVNSTSAWTSSEHINLASGKSYYINGSQVLSNSALITSSASFDLVNTNATTVNFAGAATTLTIGATNSGTTTIRNDLSIGGGDITTSSATIPLMIKPAAASGVSVTGSYLSIYGADASGTGTVTGGAAMMYGGQASGGTTNTGGSVTVDGGYGATAGGTVSIGNAYAAAVNIGRSGIVTTITGDVYVTQNAVWHTAINAQTVSYALLLSDDGKVVTINNASANTLTIPKNATQPFPIGSQVTIIQLGAGQTTIAPVDVTVNLRTTTTLKLRSQYSAATVLKIATDEWIVFGDLAVV